MKNPLTVPRALLTVALASALILLSASVPAAADPSLDAKEETLLQLLNEYRQDNGRDSLAPSAELNAAADWFANDMVSKGYYADDHLDSLGRNPTQRGADFGYPWGVGENLGAGSIFDDPQRILDAWKGSPSHNANLLGSSYEMVGIATDTGSYGWYWVLDFGTVLTEPAPDATSSPATPTPPPPGTTTPTPSPTPSTSPTMTPAPLTGLPVISGDANCDLKVATIDALAVLRSNAGYEVDSDCISNGNVDCDDDHDALDALAILRWIVSQPISLDDGCPPIGATL